MEDFHRAPFALSKTLRVPHTKLFWSPTNQPVYWLQRFSGNNRAVYWLQRAKPEQNLPKRLKAPFLQLGWVAILENLKTQKTMLTGLMPPPNLSSSLLLLCFTDPLPMWAAGCHMVALNFQEVKNEDPWQVTIVNWLIDWLIDNWLIDKWQLTIDWWQADWSNMYNC